MGYFIFFLKMKKNTYTVQSVIPKFPKILDALLEGIQILDFNWQYIYVNDAAAAHGKTTKEELLGNTLMAKYPRIEDTPLFEVLLRCMKERITQSIENEFQYEDNTKKWFELSIQPVEEGLFILSIDITGRKEAEAKLNKINHLYSFISQVNKNIVRVKNEDTLFLNACRMACEFGQFKMAWIGLFRDNHAIINLETQFGMPEEVIPLFKNGVCQVGGPQDYVVKTQKFFACNDIENEKEVNIQRWVSFAHKYELKSCLLLPIRKFGEIIGTLNLYSSQSDFLGEEEIDLLVEVAKDISFALDTLEQTRRTEEAERQVLGAERRFRALIEKNSDMITLSNENGNILYVSPSALNIFGYTLNEFLSLTPSSFIHPDNIAEFAKNRHEISEKQGASFSMQLQLRHKNGKWIWCETNMTNMLEEPTIQAFIANFRDISERKETEHQLEAQNEALMKTNAELDRFVYSASHELRAPLTSVLGLLSLIEMTTKEAETLEYAKMIRTSVNRLDEFIKNILGYSKNNRTDLCIEKIEIAQSITEIMGTLRNIQNTEDIDFKLDIAENISFSSDKLRFNAVMENLISNAIKYQKKGNMHKWIKISAKTIKNRLEISVEDNGIGIAPAHHHKIFDMFFRLSGKIPGSGIGLYIVKEMVEKIQGSIQLSSEEERGTIFRLSLKNWEES